MKKTYLILIAFLGLTAGITAQTQPAATPQVEAAPMDAPATDDLAAYAGKYKFSGEFQGCLVRIKNGEMWAEVDSYGENKLLKQTTADVFQSTSSYGTVFTFVRDPETKAINGLKLELMGMSIIGEKAVE